MSGPFRFEPPRPGATAVRRPRLAGRLQDRWDHRLTLVLGGAGFGKTTVLGQAMEEARLQGTGRDVWIGVDPVDGDGRLATDLLTALTGTTPTTVPDARRLAEAVLQLAPTPVCLVLDDVHLLEPGCLDHRLLEELCTVLPANGHLMMAGRHDPQLPVARLAATGQLVSVDEPDLALDDDETTALAAARQVDPAPLQAAGGWPAMVDLLATAGRKVALEFLWQEVIEPLGPDRRHVLAALVDLGGGDDALLSVAMGTQVDLEEALRGVPLMASSDDGWFRPHALWWPMARLRLDDNERLEVRRRAAGDLVSRGRFDDAFALLADAGLWDDVPAVLRAACGGLAWHPPAEQLRRWLGRIPAGTAEAAPVALGAGVLASLEAPDHAVEPLQRARAGFADAGDVDGELAAITHLGRVAWWTNDMAVLGSIAPRVAELADEGLPVARSLDAIGRGLICDLASDDEGMARALASADQRHLGRTWAPIIDWMTGIAHYLRGDLEAARTVSAAALAVVDDPTYRETLEGLHEAVSWRLDPLGAPPAGDGSPRRRRGAVEGVAHNRVVAAASEALRLAHCGEVERAREVLATIRDEPVGARPIAIVRVAVAEAAIAVVDDEAAAADRLRPVVDEFPVDGTARRIWRECLPLTYVLLPETRESWAAAPLGGFWVRSREHAGAVVALRDGVDPDVALSAIAPVAAGPVLAHLHHHFAVEIAVALAATGSGVARDILERSQRSGRDHVRTVAAAPSHPLGRAAKALLAAVPAAPTTTSRVELIGPFVLRRDGTSVDDPILRRERVRALIGFLGLHRRPTREQVVDALWPELDAKAGMNNLRVTLNHCHRLLDPHRKDGEPGFHVRADGPLLYLHRSDVLTLDLDDFERHLELADAAERDGVPSQALDHLLIVSDLWRGELCGDLQDAAWLDPARERVRFGTLRTLRRAAQLSLATGEASVAQRLADGALGIDPWDEGAHAVLVAVALARDDRRDARRIHARAVEALAELGVPPGPELLRLARAIG